MQRVLFFSLAILCLLLSVAAPSATAQHLVGPDGQTLGPGGCTIGGGSTGGGSTGGGSTGGGSTGGGSTGGGGNSGSCIAGSMLPCCGDGVCSLGEMCVADCGAVCGDGLCQGSETCSTCSDCGPCPTCGDGICNGTETCATCSDCSSCFNAPFQAYYRGDDTEYLYNAYSHDGSTWYGNQRLGNGSMSRNGPASVVFDDRIFLFYRGSSNSEIYVSWSDDGVVWSGNRPLGNGARTSESVGAAVFNNRIYVFNKGESDDAVWVSSSWDGLSWSAADHSRIVSDADGTPWAPTAVVFASRLHVYYVGDDTDIHGLSTSNGTVWAPEASLAAGAKHGVGLAVLGNHLHMVFGENETLQPFFSDPDRIKVVSKTALGGWGPRTVIGQGRFDERPGLTSDGTQLVLWYKDEGSHKNRFTTSTDGVNWAVDSLARGRTDRGGPDVIYVD
ncbi:MAG: hypothetical protein AAGF23_10780 [Acidobacteriota bacterium]